MTAVRCRAAETVAERITVQVIMSRAEDTKDRAKKGRIMRRKNGLFGLALRSLYR